MSIYLNTFQMGKIMGAAGGKFGGAIFEAAYYGTIVFAGNQFVLSKRLFSY